MTSPPLTALQPGRVWITYGGHCVHTHPGCPALADGQDKARAHGMRPWRIVSTSPEGARGRRACRVCHAPTPSGGWTDTDDRILRIAHANGRSVTLIAGMLDRTEAQVAARMCTLGLEKAA